MSIQISNALGVGASFKTTEFITALVDAERAPQESRINRRIKLRRHRLRGWLKPKLPSAEPSKCRKKP